MSQFLENLQDKLGADLLSTLYACLALLGGWVGVSGNNQHLEAL